MNRGILCCVLWLANMGIIGAVEPIPAKRAGADSEVRLLQRLSRSTDFDFDAIELDEACEAIAEEYAMPIVIDTLALEDSSIDSTELVSLRVKGVTLRSAMSIMLRPLGLTYAVKHEVLMVTTADRARDNRFYNISQLSRAGVSPDEITGVCAAISNEQAPASPVRHGGPATQVRRGFCRIVGGGALLVVNATDEEHAVIANSLAAMNAVLCGVRNRNDGEDDMAEDETAEEEVDEEDLFGIDDSGCDNPFGEATGNDRDDLFGADPFGGSGEQDEEDPFGEF